MDIEKLLHALNNDNNEAIVDLDYAKIAKAKNDILQQLNLPRKDLTALHKKLKLYRYVDDLKDVRYGSYIRWISLKNPADIKLTNGGIICDMKAYNKDDGEGEDIHIKCKNNMNRIFQIKISEIILFQKLSEQEQVILKALKLLQD
jgi:hypothetical protein